MTEYTCPFCGTKYSNLNDYAACVTKCNAKDIEARKKAEEARRRAEQEAERTRKETAHMDRMAKIKQLESDLAKLYEEEYREYPQSRADALIANTNFLSELFPELFKARW